MSSSLGLLPRGALAWLACFVVACGPTFLENGDVPSSEHCSLLESQSEQRACLQCFATHGVYAYERPTLMTNEHWTCRTFFAYRSECHMLVAPEVTAECEACIAKRAYYRSDRRACEAPSTH